MTTRRAACSCGNLRLTARGDPIRVSVCHCHACQRRTGSVFGVQARFSND
ncbi:MAG: aldehyde-activating protein, partial [Gammaproteobacteria bacterium]|nr:aldehyde-activating protein [Gammaproteobacteria bacterium]